MNIPDKISIAIAILAIIISLTSIAINRNTMDYVNKIEMENTHEQNN